MFGMQLFNFARKRKFGSLVIILCMVLMELLATLTTIILKVKLFNIIKRWVREWELFSYVTGKCSATGTLSILQAKEGYSLQYLYYLLKVFNFEPYKTGVAIPHIYFKDYGKAKIFCPSYSEQLRYAKLLSVIDNKLLAEQNILTNFGLQKQYLLRQMFI